MRFLCDAMLGRLARWLRAAGHDALLARDAQQDRDLLETAAQEDRVLLTLDRALAGRRAGQGRVLLLGSERIEAQARERWELKDCLIIHRYGEMAPGDMIMMVATASPHRVDAFEAAEFLMDYLKSRAPFWKKEITPEGEAWVDSKAEDEDALARW